MIARSLYTKNTIDNDPKKDRTNIDVATFNPESYGYDMKTALKYGLRPNEDGHWGSRAELTKEETEKLGFPEGTGILLKGRKHKTWDLAVDEEKKLGYDIVKKDGRYYSVPQIVTYGPYTMKELEVVGEAPNWLQYQQEYEESNPYIPYETSNQFIKRFAPEREKAMDAYRKKEWERKRDNYVRTMVEIEAEINDLYDYEENKENMPWYEKRLEGVRGDVEEKISGVKARGMSRLDWRNKPLGEKIALIGGEALLDIVPELGAWRHINKLRKANKLVNVGDNVSSFVNKVDDIAKTTKKTIKETTKPKKAFSTYYHDPKYNPNIKWKKDDMGNTRPFNEETGKWLQDEFIEEFKEYTKSKEFNRIFDTYYPNANKSLYIEKILKNLEYPISFNPAKTGKKALGLTTSKEWIRTEMKDFVTKIKISPTGSAKGYLKHINSLNHEARHQATNIHDLLPETLTKKELIENAKKGTTDLQYLADESEFDTRLLQLKKDLKKMGIVDYFNEPVKKEHIEKAIEMNKELSDEMMDLINKRIDIIFSKKGRKLSRQKKIKIDNIEKKQTELINENKGRKHPLSLDTYSLIDTWPADFLAKKAGTILSLGAFATTLNKLQQNGNNSD